MNKPIKVNEKILYENAWKKVLIKEIKNKSGKISTYPTITHSGEKFATMVIPLTEDNKIVYCKEWRTGIEDFVYNFPFGFKEKDISFEINAKKELKEEAGCTSDNLLYLGESVIVNYDDTIVKYFIALDCNLGENNLEDGEYLEVKKSSIKSFEEKVLSGIINCPVTISCYTLAKLKGLLE